MILSTMEIVTITSCICLSPSGLLDKNGNVANSALAGTYKPCRSASGRCSHCITALKFFSEGGKNHSTTRALMYWLRKSTKVRDEVKRFDKSMSVEEPFFGTHPNRANWCPFREVYKHEILKGLSSNIYLEKEISLCNVKALALKKYGSDAVKDRDIRIKTGYNLQGRYEDNLLREKTRLSNEACEVAKKTNRLRIQAALIAKYKMDHPPPPPPPTTGVTETFATPTPMVLFTDSSSDVSVAPTTAPNPTLVKRIGGPFKKKYNNSGGTNKFSNVTMEDTDLVIPTSDKRTRIFQARACACQNPDHIGDEVDFYVTRKLTVAKHWSKLLLVNHHRLTTHRIYVHFSHFRNEDYTRASPSSDCYLKRGAEPNKTLTSLYTTKKELIQQLNTSANITNRVLKRQDGSPILTEYQEQPPSSRLCICFLGEACREILPEYGFHHVPENLIERKKWIKRVCPKISSKELQVLMDSKARVVDRRHFSLTQLIVPPAGSSRRVRLKYRTKPNQSHVAASSQYHSTLPVISSPISDRKTTLFDSGNFRNILVQHNIAPKQSLIEDLLHILDSAKADSVISSATRMSLLSTPVCSAPEVPECRKNLLRDIKADHMYCQEQTGEPSFEVLESIFGWLDADNAFTTMHLDQAHHRKKTVEVIDYATLTPEELAKEKVRQMSIVQEHKHTDLTPFEQFILFAILFHRGIADCIGMIARDFGILVDTARRYYNAFLCGVSFFCIHMQPNPTYLEMLATTPPLVAETINPGAAQGIHAVVVSDCTEREIEAPSLCAFFHFLYSVYKQGTRIKHLTIASMNGLLHIVGTSAPIDDAECVKLLGVAERLGAALRSDQQLTGNQNFLMTFVYDKGLDSFPAFIRNMVRVVLPDKKAPQQLVFKVTSGEKDSSVAKVRNLIELLNCELKQKVGFNRELCLSRIDMAAHEVNVARFFVNLRPEFRAKDVLAASDEPTMQTRPIDINDVHDSDSTSCFCSACRLFNSIPKGYFQKSDV
jgi:hypothetical protein